MKKWLFRTAAVMLAILIPACLCAAEGALPPSPEPPPATIERPTPAPTAVPTDTIIDHVHHPEQYPGFAEVQVADVPALARFFAAQPEDAFRFFRPHEFDEKTLRKLQRRKSFLMYCVRNEEGRIVGYFFLRCFFIGKAFLGKMVDENSQGKGIGTQMCLCAMDIAQALGLRMFETISKENIASLRSTEKVLNTRIVEEMENGYLYIEDLGRKTE